MHMGNILIGEDGFLTLIDFVESVLHEGDVVKAKGGATFCQAPEVLINRQPDLCSDTWSMGKVWYDTIFSGKRLFEAENDALTGIVNIIGQPSKEDVEALAADPQKIPPSDENPLDFEDRLSGTKFPIWFQKGVASTYNKGMFKV